MTFNACLPKSGRAIESSQIVNPHQPEFIKYITPTNSKPPLFPLRVKYGTK
jgi:hypothetical protein